MGFWAFGTMRLADFQPLLTAEEDVVARLLTGAVDRLGDGSCPAKPDPSRVVRAAFLRFLMLGGEDGCRPHEKGVRISGAWITDVLDLEACLISRDIGLSNCHFEASPVLRAAIINRLFWMAPPSPDLRRNGWKLEAGFICVERRFLAKSAFQRRGWAATWNAMASPFASPEAMR